MENYTLNKRDIQFARKDAVKLLTKCLIERNALLRPGEEVIMKDIYFASAKRISNEVNIKVKVGSEWKYIPSAHDDKLIEAYTDTNQKITEPIVMGDKLYVPSNNSVKFNVDKEEKEVVNVEKVEIKTPEPVVDEVHEEVSVDSDPVEDVKTTVEEKEEVSTEDDNEENDLESVDEDDEVETEEDSAPVLNYNQGYKKKKHRR